MLFKLIDNNGKFVEYKSVCVSDADINNVAQVVVEKLKKTESKFFNRVISYNFNIYSYRSEQVIITCRSSPVNQISFILKEVPSIKRQRQIKENNSSYINSWRPIEYESSAAFTINYRPTITRVIL